MEYEISVRRVDTTRKYGVRIELSEDPNWEDLQLWIGSVISHTIQEDLETGPVTTE